MPKQSGIGWTTFTIEASDGSTANDLRNDITNFSMATPRGVQDVTGLDKSAMERILLLADLSYTLAGVFNPSASKSHLTLRTVSSTNTQRTTVTGIAGESMTAQILFTDYSLARGADGAFTWSAPGVLADGTVPTWVTA